jgi:HEPN domain-containing protein
MSGWQCSPSTMRTSPTNRADSLAQQAVEKAIKAVLAFRGVRYRRTHDLSELLDRVKAQRIVYPIAMEECVALTPFAAEMRYDYLPPEAATDEPFDRSSALVLVRTALEWAEKIIGKAGSEQA